MTDDDLIRRGDAERSIKDAQCEHDYNRECCNSVAVGALLSTPADPIATAAMALAEAKSKPNVCFGTLHDGSARYEGFECSTCGHKWYPGGPVLWPRKEWHHEACPAGKYRAAVEASK